MKNQKNPSMSAVVLQDLEHLDGVEIIIPVLQVTRDHPVALGPHKNNTSLNSQHKRLQ